MDFVTVRELGAESGKVWEKIETGEEIVITRNGKPFALLVHAEPAEIEGKLRALQFEAALREMQRIAREKGLNKMTMEEIDTEIAAARKQRRERTQGGR